MTPQLTWKEARARAQQRGCNGACACRECCIDEALQSVGGPVPALELDSGKGLGGGSASRPARRVPAPTDRQLDFIASLWEQREFPGAEAAQALAFGTYDDDFGPRQASALIDVLKGLPRRGTRERNLAQQRAEAELEVGRLYAHSHPHRTDLADIEIYRVQRSKSSGKLYALRVLDGGGTEYAPGMVTRLDPAAVLSLEAAQAWGQRTGTCCQCYAKLTNPESIELGIGPVCRGKFA